MLRQLLRPAVSKALTPAMPLSGRCYVGVSSLMQPAGRQQRVRIDSKQGSAFSNGRLVDHTPGSWRCMSKSANASSASKVSHNTEEDKQFAASQSGTAETTPAPQDLTDRLLQFFQLQPLEDGDRSKILCEFVTQAVFNFMSCGAVAMAKVYAGSNAAMTMGLIMGAHLVLLPIMIFTAGPISGAHFNPMVTSVFMMARMQSVSSGVCYIIAQCLGGILGAAGAFYSLPANLQQVGFAGVQGVPMDRTVGQAFLGEIYASFFFVFVLMGMVVDKRGWGKFGPFAVPLAICLDMWILGPVSSMCINPARALGPALVTGYWDNHWLWWTAPFIGGLTAGKLYTKFWMPKDQLPAALKALKK